MTLSRKDTGRFTGMFVGNDDGAWAYWPKIQLGSRKMGWTWEAIIGMFSRNEGRNISVEGATEQHRGFQKAVFEMVDAYPELREFVIDFDGPKMPVPELLAKLSGASRGTGIDWKTIEFYHGTSSVVVPDILRNGLKPRGSGKAVYGAVYGSAEGRSDAIYLTTQLGMAHHAARQAAVTLGGVPTVLLITGLSGRDMVPDEDSREATAEGSLGRMGSVAHLGTIAPSHIRKHSELHDNEWIEMRRGGKRRHARSSLVKSLREVNALLRRRH